MSRFATTRRAFFLVEAMLTTVAVAVGLVFVSRGLGESLKGLARLEQYDRLLHLGESMLRELEVQLQHAPSIPPAGGSFADPDDGYEWALSSQLVPFDPGSPSAFSMASVTLTARRQDSRPPVVRIDTLWPKEWIGQ